MQKIKDSNFFAARLAVSATFFTIGAIFANWISRLPDVSQTLNLSEGALGLALMLGSAGVIIGLLMASGLIARFGSRNVSFFGAFIYAIVLGIIGLSFNFITLSVSLFFAGMCN